MPKSNLCKPREDPRGKELRAIILGGMVAGRSEGKTRNTKKKHIDAILVYK